MFGNIFSSAPSRFGSILQDVKSRFGNLYEKAQQIPAVKAKLEEFKVPEFIQTGKQAIEAGRGLASSLRQLYGLGRGLIPT